ncbi:MAG: OmpA family protein [Nitrospirae bacterium]|nr:OmpA family protein [Nitrospirota bacterium]
MTTRTGLAGRLRAGLLAMAVAALCVRAPRAIAAAPGEEADLTRRSAAFTGLSGLARVYTAWKIPRATLVNKLSGLYFTREPFLLATQAHERFGGYMSFTLSPAIVETKPRPGGKGPPGAAPMWESFEVAFAYGAASHVSRDVETEVRLTTESAGDVDAALKYALPWPLFGNVLHLGANTGFHMLSRMADVGPDLATISPWARFLVSADFRRFFPLQAHLNVGYLQDNTLDLFDENQPVPPRWRRYSQGAWYEDSFLLGFALDAPVWRFIPYLEATAWIDTDGDALNDAGQKVGIQNVRQNPILITPGLRAFVTQHVAFEAGADLGYLSDDFPGATDEGQKAIVPPWQLFGSVSYAFVPKLPVLLKVRRAEGRLTGKVTDAQSHQPLGRVVIDLEGPEKNLPQLASEEPSGEFVLDRLAPGAYVLVATLEGYAPLRREFEIKKKEVTTIDVPLAPLRMTGTIAGGITMKDGKALGGLVFVQRKGDATPKIMSTDAATGAFSATLDTGEYDVRAVAPGFLESKLESVRVSANSETRLAFVLDPRPEPKLIRITEEKIEILETIHFETGRAIIKPVSYPVLDEIAGTLLENLDVNVRVEGHTDDRGKLEVNVGLSQDRAESVVDYLVNKGIERSRLTAVGLGPQRPIADNATAEGRAKNRRVEFIIVGGQFREHVSQVTAPPGGAEIKWAVVATDPHAIVYEARDGKAIGRARSGQRLAYVATEEGWVSVRLKTGKVVWIKAGDVTLLP